MKKIAKYIMIVSVVIFLIVFVPILINESYLPEGDPKYITVWDGADVLAYYGAMFSAFGSIVLGYVSWGQNKRLIKLEERVVLSENACSVLIEEIQITITRLSQIPCALQTNHTGPILYVGKTTEEGDAGVTFHLKLKYLDNYPALINVKSARVFVFSSENKNPIILTAEDRECIYSQPAIFKEHCCISCTVIIPEKEYRELVDRVRTPGSRLDIECGLSVLTSKYVETRLKCRSIFERDADCVENKNGDRINYQCAVNPMFFWYGSYMMDRENIQIKLHLEDLDLTGK